MITQGNIDLQKSVVNGFIALGHGLKDLTVTNGTIQNSPATGEPDGAISVQDNTYLNHDYGKLVVKDMNLLRCGNQAIHALLSPWGSSWESWEIENVLATARGESIYCKTGSVRELISIKNYQAGCEHLEPSDHANSGSHRPDGIDLMIANDKDGNKIDTQCRVEIENYIYKTGKGSALRFGYRFGHVNGLTARYEDYTEEAIWIDPVANGELLIENAFIYVPNGVGIRLRGTKTITDFTVRIKNSTILAKQPIDDQLGRLKIILDGSHNNIESI